MNGVVGPKQRFAIEKGGAIELDAAQFGEFVRRRRWRGRKCGNRGLCSFGGDFAGAGEPEPWSQKHARYPEPRAVFRRTRTQVTLTIPRAVGAARAILA